MQSAGLAGAGYNSVAQGAQNLGNAVASYAATERDAQRKLDDAWAKTNLTVAFGKLDNELPNQSDLETLRTQYPKSYEDAFNGVLNTIPDERQREMFRANYSDELAKRQLAIGDRVRNVEKDNFIVGMNQSLDGLRDVAKSTDAKQHALALSQAGEFIDAARDKGYISPEQAEKAKNDWTKNLAVSVLGSMPAQDRLAAVTPLLKGDVTAKDLQPHQRAFLNAIAGPESNGAYNVRYTANGGAAFELTGEHPRMKEVIQSGPNKGKTSDAAGRYQFLSSTWDSLPKEAKGDGKFTPENQDRAAWYLAKQDYRRNTGRDLDADLKEKGFTPEVASALGATWEGFKTNPGKAVAAYNASIRGEQIDRRLASTLTPDELRKVEDASWKEIEIDDARAKAAHRETLQLAREQSEAVASQYATEIYTSKNAPDLINRIGSDPNLTWETKRALVNMVQSEGGVDDVEKAKREGGPGYWEAYKSIIAPPGDPNRLDNLDTLFTRAGPGGDLTQKGVAQLISIRNQLAKNPDAQAVHSAKVHLMDYAKSKLSFDQEMLFPGMKPLADERGRQSFNAQFIPAFEQAYSKWVEAGKNPWEFLTQKNVDEVMKPFMRSKAQLNADRIAASGESLAGSQKGPEAVPPAPKGVDQAAWGEAMMSRPSAKDGKPWPVRNWAAYLDALRKSPTPENIKEFADKYPDIDLSAILSKLNPTFEEAAR